MSTVAVAGEGGVVASANEIVGTRHAEVTIKQIAMLTADCRSDLTHIAVGVGPGPYTSTRVGVATGLALGKALKIPVVGICTLDAIAAGVIHADRTPSEDFGVASDARRREIYWAKYRAESEQVVRVGEPLVGPPTEVIAAHPNTSWAGDGLTRYPELVAECEVRVIDPAFPDAVDVARLAIDALLGGEVTSATSPELNSHGGDGAGAVPAGAVLLAPVPLYLRRPDAQPLTKHRVAMP